jgi:hypothetical protein
MSSTMPGLVADGEVPGRRDRGSNAFGLVAGQQRADPGAGDSAGPRDLADRALLNGDSGNDQPGLRHPRSVRPARSPRPQADKDEVTAVRWVDLSTLLAEIASGDLIDSFTMAAITLAAARGMLTLPAAAGH